MSVGDSSFQAELKASAYQLRRLYTVLSPPPTQAQIADRAGVSTGTVSSVLRGRDHPTMDVYISLVRTLIGYRTGSMAPHNHQDIKQWRERWLRVQELKIESRIENRTRRPLPARGAAAQGLAEQVVLAAMRRGDRVQMFPMADGLDGIWDVDFSPDGQMLATAHGLRTVQLWNTVEQSRSGKALMGGHVQQVETVRFSSDGRMLASGSADGRIMLWDTATGNALTEPLVVSSGRAWAVAFSPDNRLLLGAGRTVRLWDVSQPDQPEVVTKLGGNLSGGLAISPTGLLVTGHGDGTAQIWDLGTFEKRGSALRGHSEGVTSAAFSPDGALLATASRGVVQLWDTSSNEMAGEPLTEAVGNFQAIAFSPNGQLLIGVANPTARERTKNKDHSVVHVWNTTTWAAACDPLQGHTAAIWGAAFSPDSQLFATGGEDGLLRLWILPHHTNQSW